MKTVARLQAEKGHILRGKRYVVEDCPNCGYPNLVREDKVGTWNYCKNCSDNSYYKRRP
jgi:predicted RNA-binding Zn-ribbon protein involved in translation (DUF1610 family)